jgi:hypothetical protein
MYNYLEWHMPWGLPAGLVFLLIQPLGSFKPTRMKGFRGRGPKALLNGRFDSGPNGTRFPLGKAHVRNTEISCNHFYYLLQSTASVALMTGARERHAFREGMWETANFAGQMHRPSNCLRS